ncbi:hypothetical protein B0H13DRAFT_2411429 [Mycena leptocephala]|nr:hypothetical protein B0H13DRAFT_2411429 [Mycena leptocephala]
MREITRSRSSSLLTFLLFVSVPFTHTPPGYNHSGKLGQIDFLDSVMGYANAQRMLDDIRAIVEFISQPQYKDLISMLGIVNEGACLQPTCPASDATCSPPYTLPCPSLFPSAAALTQRRSYLQAHNMIRGIAGYSAGYGPFISIQDDFQGTASWAGFLSGSDRIIFDTHPYFAFDGAPNDSPIAPSTDPLEAGGIWYTFVYTLHLPLRSSRSIVLYLSLCNSLFPPYLTPVSLLLI